MSITTFSLPNPFHPRPCSAADFEALFNAAP